MRGSILLESLSSRYIALIVHRNYSSLCQPRHDDRSRSTVPQTEVAGFFSVRAFPAGAPRESFTKQGPNIASNDLRGIFPMQDGNDRHST